ncbi:S41 family peptidase [Candidatus Dojkabacteria bacterium]|uniref:S41 family peptidase n=1 Tax=Candidatus Dojkabacteria bacterium TaxID=2099670 RepID=A0A955L3M5_9BACT|nr:S41 family peptidase [Candidatus Dojkabacteria bacterium]
MEEEVKANKKKTNIAKFASYITIGVIALAIGLAAGITISNRTDSTNLNDSSALSSLFGRSIVTQGNSSGKAVLASDVDMSVFWDVWAEIQQKYVNKEVDQKTLVDGAVKGMVASLGDPATIYYTQEETKEYDKLSAGEFEGIGAEIGYDNGQKIIKTPLKGSPAEKSGLMPGDIILKVNGEDVADLSLTETVLKIRGEKGSEVTLTIIGKDKKERDVKVTRDSIFIPSIEYKTLDDGIILLTINRFSDSSFANFTAAWDKVAADMKKENPKKIIIDLRSDPGGFLDGAPYIASDFLPVGSIVLKTEDRNGIDKEFKVERKGEFLDTPVVILINGGTASAAEIFAGALRYYDRAQIIGENTVGKGTSQSILGDQAWNGATLHLTIQKWLLPDGKWLNPDNPIVPDIKVEFTNEQFLKGQDPQLDKAIEVINKSK